MSPTASLVKGASRGHHASDTVHDTTATHTHMRVGTLCGIQALWVMGSAVLGSMGYGQCGVYGVGVRERERGRGEKERRESEREKSLHWPLDMPAAIHQATLGDVTKSGLARQRTRHHCTAALCVRTLDQKSRSAR